MNCQDCKHCQPAVGSSHHKECKFPIPKQVMAIILHQYAGGVANTNPTHLVANMKDGSKMPLIDINPHGIRNGWATWPFNFDPIWINSCLMFCEEETKEVEVEIKNSHD